ncbi:MAG: N-acetylneuraminate lyase [Tissierellia bacterium]|nr:N-acetylneuraminate lyase [Tissierellia bacterium]
MREDLKGLFSALLVPFDKNGEVNEEGLRQIIRHNIENMKVDGLYVGGSTGENFLIDEQTKKQILKIAKDEAKDDVKLIAQIGGNNVYEDIRLGKLAKELGYDAVSAVTPFYYPFSFEEVKEYYNDLTNNIDLDMIVYSIPVLTGVHIGIDQFGELFENERIIGVKFTQADFFMLERMRKKYKDVLIYSGFDEMLYPALIYNVDGAIGSTYNVNGIRARGIMDAVKNEDMKEALRLQHESNDLIEAILENGLYPTLKAILQLQGCDKGEFFSRKPMGVLTEEQRQRSKEIFEKYL